MADAPGLTSSEDEDAPVSLDLRKAREAAERQVVVAALARSAGNMARGIAGACRLW
jgi:threonine dehydratase